MTRPDPSAVHLSSGLLVGAVSAGLTLVGGLTHSPEMVIFGTVVAVPAALLTIIGVYRLASAVDYLVRATAGKRDEAKTPA